MNHDKWVPKHTDSRQTRPEGVKLIIIKKIIIIQSKAKSEKVRL